MKIEHKFILSAFKKILGIALSLYLLKVYNFLSHEEFNNISLQLSKYPAVLMLFKSIPIFSLIFLLIASRWLYLEIIQEFTTDENEHEQFQLIRIEENLSAKDLVKNISLPDIIHEYVSKQYFKFTQATFSSLEASKAIAQTKIIHRNYTLKRLFNIHVKSLATAALVGSQQAQEEHDKLAGLVAYKI